MLKLLVKIFLIAAAASCPMAAADHDTISPMLLNVVKQRYGQPAEYRLIAWQRLIRENMNAPEMTKIKAVNDFFNKVAFASDQDHWAKKDYWATPVEFLATNRGDCEDFSIAKYFTLKELGISTNRLRIIYVKATRINQAHMVLAYYKSLQEIPFILDNLVKQISPANQRTDLKPVYSFNADSVWLAESGIYTKMGRAEDLGLWQNLNERFTSELSL